MDNIATLTPALESLIQNSPASTMTAVGTALLDTQLDTIDTMSNSMLKMMENSVTPYLGGNIDVSV